MSDNWQAMKDDALAKLAVADAAEAEATRLGKAHDDAIDAAQTARAIAEEADQASMAAEAYATPDEPVFNVIDGRRVRLTPEERDTIKAAWAENARRLAEAKAAEEAAAQAPTLDEKLAAMSAQIEAIKAGMDALQTTRATVK